MSSPVHKVLELVVFGLREGASREDVLATSEAVSGWAGRQPGFISRELSYDAEGDRWIDVVWWKTLDDARAAADRAMTSESCAPMFALIDMDRRGRRPRTRARRSDAGDLSAALAGLADRVEQVGVGEHRVHVGAAAHAV